MASCARTSTAERRGPIRPPFTRREYVVACSYLHDVPKSNRTHLRTNVGMHSPSLRHYGRSTSIDARPHWQSGGPFPRRGSPRGKRVGFACWRAAVALTLPGEWAIVRIDGAEKRLLALTLTVFLKSPVTWVPSLSIRSAFPSSQKLSVRRPASVMTFVLIADDFIRSILI
jgi:hypothetical protein